MRHSKQLNIPLKNQYIKRKLRSTLKQSLVNSSSLRSYYEPLIQSFIPSWSVKKFRAKVLGYERLNQKVISLTLKPSKKWSGFEPGQYIELTIEKDGALMTRCFSISSSRQLWLTKGHVQLTIREQDQGRVTPWLFEGLKKTSYVQISKAKGKFTLQSAKASLLLAGGTGITPIMSMISSLNHVNEHIDLIYFSREPHLFQKELNALSEHHEKLSIHLINTATQGHCSLKHLNELCPDFLARDLYLCGPSQMSEAISELLDQSGFDTKQLFQEHFLPIRKNYSVSRINANQANTNEDRILKNRTTQELAARIAFKKAGLTANVEATNEQTLLEAAEEARLSPSYGCRMGICHQCTCKKNKGVVLNTVTGEVSDTSEEVIQLCVSVPLSDLEVEL